MVTTGQVIVEQTKFYKQDLGITYQILLTLSTQILGYALAGITRQYLVRPSGMIWPATLVSTAMFTTLHQDQNKPANGWTITRSRFFMFVFGGSVVFYFLPGFLMPALSYFSVITWFAPNNVVVANLVSYPALQWSLVLIFLVWYCFRSRSVSCDFRLGSNRLYWFTSGDSFLGRP